MNKHFHNHSHAVDSDVASGHLKVSLILNLCFALAEIVIGLLANSMAILSDAVHDLMDSASLMLSLIASWVSQRPPDEKRSFGYRRASILAAFINSSILVVTSAFIGFHAIRRLLDPVEVGSGYMLLAAALSVIINGYAVLRMRHDRHGDLNLESVFMHLLEDALGGVGLLVGGLIIRFTGWYVVDSIIAIALSAFVLRGALRIVMRSINVFMEGVPEDVDIGLLEKALLSHPMVVDVHHIHVWMLDASNYSMSVHVRLKDRHLPKGLYAELAELVKPYKINHLTVQAEGPDGACLPCC
ncbi:MAG: cation diffusion facilitator family transporter [Bacillota bacterium]